MIFPNLNIIYCIYTTEKSNKKHGKTNMFLIKMCARNFRGCFPIHIDSQVVMINSIM